MHDAADFRNCGITDFSLKDEATRGGAARIATTRGRRQSWLTTVAHGFYWSTALRPRRRLTLGKLARRATVGSYGAVVARRHTQWLFWPMTSACSGVSTSAKAGVGFPR